MRSIFARFLTVALGTLVLGTMSTVAWAGVTTVDLTNFSTFNTGLPGGLNSQVLLALEPNAEVTSITFENLAIELSNGSFGNEFVISANQSANTGAAGTFWDYSPFPDADSAATPLGPISGAFTNPSNQFNSGPFTLLPDGQLLLYVYETFNDGGAGIDARVTSGTLTITTTVATVVPEAGTLALVLPALGLIGAVVVRRRLK
ncbi:MAG: hypothetical protein H7Y38_04215 [Armatimonadetes bacterium]|nr:hypothetical protein [Armatimonadota bacterium]